MSSQAIVNPPITINHHHHHHRCCLSQPITGGKNKRRVYAKSGQTKTPSSCIIPKRSLLVCSLSLGGSKPDPVHSPHLPPPITK